MKAGLRLLCVAALVAGGCDAKRCSIGGTIRVAGNPVEPHGETGHLLVIFFPEDRVANKEVYSAETDRSKATYRIKAIPAGMYRVAIQQFDEGHNDSLRKAYDPYVTPLRAEVKEDGQAIDFDLPKAAARPKD